jgi:threonine dehydrogenase-like Zn-dependent dehydrogenase
VRADALVSGISHGTELAAYRGTSPHHAKRFDRELRLFIEHGDGSAYPATLGYDWVGAVREIGDGVAGIGVGDLVQAPLPHRDTQTFTHAGDGSAGSPAALPPGLPPDRAVFVEPARIALAAVHDARVRVGDRVAVFGLGVFGLLAVQLARLSGAGWIDAVDPLARRRALAGTLGADRTLDPAAGDVAREVKSSCPERGADVAIEFSGQAAALHEAIRSVRVGGTVVGAGFYQGGAGALRLGEEWHHNRVTLVASMSGWGNVHRDAPAWDRPRLRAVAVDLLATGTLRTDGFVTHRFPFERAAEAYELIERRPAKALKVILLYEPAGSPRAGGRAAGARARAAGRDGAP